MVTGLLSLPNELLLEIVSRIDRFALLALSQVSRRFLHLSFSSRTYWHSDYVPAFLPVAPINEITAAQFREAAIRSWRTRRILMDPSSRSRSTLPRYSSQERRNKVVERNSNTYKFHQTIGSRFLFEIQRDRIVFWDAHTGRKVLPMCQLSQQLPLAQPSQSSSSNSTSDLDFASASNISPFFVSSTPLEVGHTMWYNNATSICVSTDQVRVALFWHIGNDRESKGFLERMTVTFKTHKAIRKIDLSQKNHVHNRDAGGNGNGNSSQNGENEDDDEIYAEYQWHTAIPVYHVDAPDMRKGVEIKLWRMTERYVAICLKFLLDDNVYVRLYDWNDPRRPSYIYCENHSVSELICTHHHLTFISTHLRALGRGVENAKNRVYIRPIPLRKWFPDSNMNSVSNVNARSLQEGWVMEERTERKLRFPGIIGRIFIEDEYKKEYQENTLPIYYNALHAIGSTDTANFDSSAFTIFTFSPSDARTAGLKLEYYNVFIPSIQSLGEKKKVVRHTENTEATIDIGQDYIRILGHGYHPFSLPALAISKAIGLGDTVGVDESEGAKDKGEEPILLNGHNGPYTFIYLLKENKQILGRMDFLISRGRSFKENGLPQGLDAHAGIATVNGGIIQEIIWF